MLHSCDFSGIINSIWCVLHFRHGKYVPRFHSEDTRPVTFPCRFHITKLLCLIRHDVWLICIAQLGGVNINNPILISDVPSSFALNLTRCCWNIKPVALKQHESFSFAKSRTMIFLMTPYHSMPSPWTTTPLFCVVRCFSMSLVRKKKNH